MQPTGSNDPSTFPTSGNEGVGLPSYEEACTYHGQSSIGTAENAGGGLRTPAADELPTYEEACGNATKGSHNCEKPARSQDATVRPVSLPSYEEACCIQTQRTDESEQSGRSEHAEAGASGKTGRSAPRVRHRAREALSNARSALTSIFREGRDSHGKIDEVPPSAPLPGPLRFNFPLLQDEWVLLLLRLSLMVKVDSVSFYTVLSQSGMLATYLCLSSTFCIQSRGAGISV